MQQLVATFYRDYEKEIKIVILFRFGFEKKIGDQKVSKFISKPFDRWVNDRKTFK